MEKSIIEYIQIENRKQHFINVFDFYMMPQKNCPRYEKNQNEQACLKLMSLNNFLVI